MTCLAETLVLCCDFPSLLSLCCCCHSFRDCLSSSDILLLLFNHYLTIIHQNAPRKPLLENLPSFIRSFSCCYFTPWTEAILGKEKAVELAAEYGFVVEVMKLYGKGDRDPPTVARSLCLAAKYGHAEVVSYLGDGLEEGDAVGTAFQEACSHNQLGVVETMVREDMYIGEDVKDYIIIAVVNDNVGILRVLLGCALHNDDLDFILITAGRHHSINIINYYLVECGDDRDQVLIFEGAIQGGHLDLVKEHEQVGFDMIDVDSYMIDAIVYGAEQSIRWLHEKGATNHGQYMEVAMRGGSTGGTRTTSEDKIRTIELIMELYNESGKH
jgi:hypothetical protein